jgi:predicted acetyltransferase
MSNIIVRPFEERDSEGYFAVRSFTYNDGLPVAPENRVFRFTSPFVAERDGEIAGVMGLLDMSATRERAVLPCAGVAGVAVMPHLRKSGVGSAMLSWLPRHLREQGVVLTHLYAFRESFYRKFGYEVCGKRIKIVCPSHRLPKVDSDLPVRRLTPDDWRLIEPCYQAFAHARSGLNIRSETMWQRVLNENKPLAIYAAGDPIEGYVAVSHSVAFWVTDHLSEVVWSTRRGYEAAMAIIGGLAINKAGFSWFEPSDSPFYARYLDQGVEAKIERPIMYRVCDVPAALRSLVPAGEGEFTIRVRDEIVPENEGPWRVVFGRDGVEVSPAADADIQIDIRQFTQAFLGEPDLRELLRHGLVDCANPAAFQAASNLLPPTPAYCPEFF